jgi:hypothetical protein
MTMAIFLPSLVRAVEVVMAYSSKERRSALPIPEGEEKDDHGHLTQQQP